MNKNKILDYAIKRINEYDKVLHIKKQYVARYKIPGCEMCNLVKRIYNGCENCPFGTTYKKNNYSRARCRYYPAVSTKEHQKRLIESAKRWAIENTDYEVVEVVK